MTMTTQEMIEVLQAHKRGEKIELLCYDGKQWVVDGFPTWNFLENDYRIAKPEPKKMYGFVNPTTGQICVSMVETTNGRGWIRAPQFDCEVEE